MVNLIVVELSIVLCFENVFCCFVFFFRLHDVNAGKLSRGELDVCIVLYSPRMPGADQEIRYFPCTYM